MTGIFVDKGEKEGEVRRRGLGWGVGEEKREENRRVGDAGDGKRKGWMWERMV